jgi:hypothetical protein
MRVYVEGVGVAGPGIAGWDRARRVLTAAEPYVAARVVVPGRTLLPAAEARRTGLPVKLALAVADEAFTQSDRDRAETATIFASSSGDGDNVHQILDILASPEREVSPTRFHNSVHNAAAGYWSIAAHSRAPSTSLCGHDASFAVGLLDAATHVVVERSAVALVAYDHPYPSPLHAKRPIAASFAVALVLAPERGAHTMAALDVGISRGAAVSRLADDGLEGLRSGVPAARSLPLLRAIARESQECVVVEYVSGATLNVEVSPCR